LASTLHFETTNPAQDTFAQEAYLIDMKRTGLTTLHWLATLALASFVWAAPAGAQSQNSANPQDRDDLTRQQLAGFDQFLDSHPDLAGQIRNNPSLVNSDEFVQNHPDLQQYLQQHPEVREDLSQNPKAVMRQEQGYERREDANSDRDRNRDNDHDITRREIAGVDSFLDSHPEIAEQLRKNPSLVNNKEFVSAHPALQQFLASHKELREELRENPSAFMSAERRYDRAEDRRVLSNMDQFLDSHPEIAEQLQKNPKLVDDKRFVASHPPLQHFLADHPDVRGQFEANPNAFMTQEQRYDRREDARLPHGRDNDVTHGELASFHQFLEGHGSISSELAKNPSLATNQEYLENHSALQTYLKTNPQVREELSENPQSFVKSAQTFDANSNTAVKGTMKLPAQPKK
jgi:hypothetical protein